MLNEQMMLESKVSTSWLSCIDCCACSIELFLKQAIWLIRKAQVCVLFYSVLVGRTVWRWANTNNVRTLKLKEQNGNHSYSSQPAFLLPVTCQDINSDSGLHLEIMNQVSGIHSTPVCIQGSNIVRWKCVMVHLSSCANLPSFLSLHTWFQLFLPCLCACGSVCVCVSIILLRVSLPVHLAAVG